MSRREVLLLAAVAVLIGVVTRVYRQMAAIPEVPVSVQGTFVPNGEYPGDPINIMPRPRTWGSWGGSDLNVGTIKLGPFLAPERLSFMVSGYPHHEGNDLFLEMPMLNLRISIPAADAAERWRSVEFEIPEGWQGWPVNLVAIDGSASLGGWLGISESIVPARERVLEIGFYTSLLAWLCNGCLLAFPFMAASLWLRRRAWLSEHWVPLAAGGVVALCAYAAFWAWLLKPVVGEGFSTIVPVASFIYLVTHTGTPRKQLGEGWKFAWLLLLIGVLYIAALHLFVNQRGFYELTANRFVDGLPGDNRIQHDLAIRLYRGASLKNWGDWLSSDRPPLESGWELLTWPMTKWLGLGAIVGSGTSAVWMQLLWVFAMYGLLRSLGLTENKTYAWLLVLSLSGFFLVNTVFTWPKLAAGSFACGAFGMWVLPYGARSQRHGIICGAVFAVLGWLSHGGVAFSFVALAPWIVWRLIVHREIRSWVLGGVAFIVLSAPWIAYQKFYDPPGDRLLKWHLAGQETKDSRSVVQALKDNYRPLSWSEIAKRKAANLSLLFAGDWRSIASFSTLGSDSRRHDEFYHVFRAFTWCIVGVLCIPYMIVQEARRRRTVMDRIYVNLAIWAASTLIVWCLLMFKGGSTVLHQGSYSAMLVVFALVAASLDAVSSWCIVAIFALQSFSLITTWLVPNSVVRGLLDMSALGCIVLVFVAIGCVVIRGSTPQCDRSLPARI